MRHLGDITKISGYDAPIVDCIIGGSPCQDLSVAGKRAGLDGERSGLYIEQVRIVKEMREKDVRNGRSGVDVRPRYMVWENVPGAFSSNKGEDFRIVLEEIAKVCDKDAFIPMPDNGKWTNHGCIVGDGWSVAWRVLDAQFWGVPQRRRRIALVADFGGQSAPEILFVRQSVSGHTDEGKPKGKGIASDAQGGIGADDKQPKLMDAYQHHGWRESDTCGTLTTGQNNTVRGDTPLVCYGISSYNSNAMKSDNPHSGIYEADTSRTLDLNGGNPSCNQGGIAIVESVPYTLKIRSGCEGGGKGALVQEDKSATLATNNDQYLFQPIVDGNILDDQGGSQIAVRNDGKSPTLRAETHGNLPCVLEAVYSVENHPIDSRVGINEDGKVQALTSRMGTGGGNVPMVLALDRASFNQGKNAQFDFEISDKGINSSLVAKGPRAVCYGIDQQGGKGGANYTVDVMPTICSDSHGTPHGVVYAVDQGGGKSACNVSEGQASTLTCTHGGEPAVCYGINGDKAGTLDSSYYKGCGMRSGVERDVVAVDCRNASEDTINGALQSGASRSLNCNNVVRTRYIVRRLTPLECERLQGYPDGWTDIGEWVDSKGKTRQTSDAARYKALGNSIALPPWKWVLKRLCACYERDATMASLFDGIGGFPYLWEQLNGKGSCLWASEIEEFPMAVTKVRIGE